ncbi:hypothetical protein RchiOBHm_Chr2g0109431 [Rosa chinensis]|uniref:Uncharacterized protein n=1 Tax=Rosa chinensis TaxID=74649 RepID=A0A2P6RPH0_ROSCH|nr:hypothetical protein RchiOBHm_Chr2g0109431 [Rosa chinensis]
MEVSNCDSDLTVLQFSKVHLLSKGLEIWFLLVFFSFGLLMKASFFLFFSS